MHKTHLGKRLRNLAACLAWGTASIVAQAHGSTQGDLTIDHPYAVPSLTGVANGAAYVRGIDNKGNVPDRLVRVSTPVAERVEIHRMAMDGTVMRMREIAAIELPAKTVTPLRHDGQYHLMLMNLKQPLKEGDHFDLTLNFEKAGSKTVNVWVQKPRDAGTEHKH